MNVYILKLGSTMYKVGKADVISKRVSQIQSQIPMKIELIATLCTKEAFLVENSIHKELSKFRVHGEWFELEDSTIAYIIEKYEFSTNVSFQARFGRKEVEKIGLDIFYSNILSESKYEMTALEKDILYVLIGKISNRDDGHKYYSVCNSDITNITGCRVRADDFLKAIDRLLTRVALYGGKEYQFLSDCIQQENNFMVKLGESIFTHILLLKNTFTDENIKIVMKLKSKYAKRFYELTLFNIKNKKTGSSDNFVVGMDYVKNNMIPDAAKYKSTASMRIKVIDNAISEINEVTDISLTYIFCKKGKKVNSMIFTYATKH